MSFPQYENQICLVSEQNLPNYLGAIVPDAFPKRVHLIVTERMKERADILEKAFRLRGYDVKQYPLAAPRPDAVQDVLDSILEKNGPEIAINVTGGTKIMALAAVDWAGVQDRPPFLFYVDTDNKKLLQIGGKMEQFDLPVSLKIKELLKAGTGATIGIGEECALSAQQRDLLDHLVQTFLKNKTALELFNKCAKEAEKSLYTNMPYGDISEFNEALAIAQRAGKLHITSGIISYTSEDTRFWCNGGWLEDFVRAKLYRIKGLGCIDDWAGNIKIFKEQKTSFKNSPNTLQPQNELDAAFTAANRLFVIECKTANLAKVNGFATASYKIDSLRKNLGGVLARGMIVSVLAPRPTDIQRCKDLRIELLYGADVLKLEEKIKTWIQNAHR